MSKLNSAFFLIVEKQIFNNNKVPKLSSSLSGYSFILENLKKVVKKYKIENVTFIRNA